MAKKSSEVPTEELQPEAADKRPEYEVVASNPDADGLKAYLAYGAALHFKTLKGEPLGSWEDLHEFERAAWRNAAFAVRTG